MLREWTRVYGALLLLMDDFERADAMSWSLLAQVAEQPDLAVLVVVAMRPSDGVFAAPPVGQVRPLTLFHQRAACAGQVRLQMCFTLAFS